MDKIDQVIKRIRWKAFFYTNKSEDTEETYGLKSLNCSTKIKEMAPFQKDLWNLVDKLKFRKIKSNFQKVKRRYKGYHMIKQSSSIRR